MTEERQICKEEENTMTAHYPCDLSLAPIDVGFDPRVHEMLCTIPASARRVRYERRGEAHTRIAEGTTEEIVAELTAAGYSIHVDAGG